MKIRLALLPLLFLSSNHVSAEKYPDQETFGLVMSTYAELAIQAYKNHLAASAENDTHKATYDACLKRKYLIAIREDSQDNINFSSAKAWKIIAENKLEQDEAALKRENPKLSYEYVCKLVTKGG